MLVAVFISDLDVRGLVAFLNFLDCSFSGLIYYIYINCELCCIGDMKQSPFIIIYVQSIYEFYKLIVVLPIII